MQCMREVQGDILQKRKKCKRVQCYVNYGCIKNLRKRETGIRTVLCEIFLRFRPKNSTGPLQPILSILNKSRFCTKLKGRGVLLTFLCDISKSLLTGAMPPLIFPEDLFRFQFLSKLVLNGDGANLFFFSFFFISKETILGLFCKS